MLKPNIAILDTKFRARHSFDKKKHFVAIPFTS